MQNIQSPLAPGFIRRELEARWPSIVGQRLAEITAPAALEDGVLEVWVAHSTWMQELWFVRDEILMKVRAVIGDEHCRELRLTLNRRQASTGIVPFKGGSRPPVPRR